MCSSQHGYKNVIPDKVIYTCCSVNDMRAIDCCKIILRYSYVYLFKDLLYSKMCFEFKYPKMSDPEHTDSCRYVGIV